MTDDQQLETTIKACTAAFNERMLKTATIRERTQAIARRQGPRDRTRYFGEWKAVYDEQNFPELYERIDSHGNAVLALTDESEITTRIQRMLQLAKAERHDVIDVVSKLGGVGKLIGFLNVIVTLLAALFRARPREAELDRLTLDLTAYCLVRSPPRAS